MDEMKPHRPSFWIDAQGSDVDAVRDAFAWLVDAVARVPEQPAVGYAVTSLKYTLQNSVPRRAIGARVADALTAGRGIVVRGGTLEHTYLAKLPTDTHGPVLALWADQPMLDKVDGMYGVTEVCIFPRMLDDVVSWVSTWEAVEINGKGRGELPRLDPILIEALAMLDDTANKGMLHPMDVQMAVDIFGSLSRARIPFDPQYVRRWLVGKLGWSPRDADKIAGKARAIAEGRTVRGSQRLLSTEIIDVWHERAAASGKNP